MPLTSLAAGVSDKGVGAREIVRISFPGGYPIVAPVITLRRDFPRNLPHIQPRVSAERVEPCLSPLTPQEAYSSTGLDAVLNSLEDWLHKAAADNLIEPTQGWEPTRRDALGDEIIADVTALRARAAGPHAVALRARFRPTRLFNGTDFEEGFFQLAASGVTAPLAGLTDLDSLIEKKGLSGDTLCLVVPCARDHRGDAVVYSEFFNSPVDGLAGLRAEAARIGVGDALGKMLDLVSSLWTGELVGFPLAVVLAARRPINLIGLGTDIELLSFVCRSGSDGRFDSGAAVRVEHARLTEAVTRPLLKNMSGSPTAIRPLIVLGAGSLGSKVAMHEIRRGEAPGWVIDNGYFRPHHAARHVLHPKALASAHDGPVVKSAAIADLAMQYDAKVEFAYDALQIDQHPQVRRRMFDSDDAVILNTTGSVSVRASLSSSSNKDLPGQVVEAGLMGAGAFALITEEGGGHNPSSSDLFLAATAVMASRDNFQRAFGQADQVRTGEGCAAQTLLMSDARVSRFAGMLGDHLTDLRSRPRYQDEGVIHILRFAGLSAEATTLTYKPFVLIAADGKPAWQIRLDPRLAAEIETRSVSASPDETGGYLIGRADDSSQTITVVALEEPPAGSSASPTRMTLAPRISDGLPEATKGGLEVVGTWHSHTTPSGPSPTDHESARKIARLDPRPRVLLIRHPDGWRALATRTLGGSK